MHSFIILVILHVLIPLFAVSHSYSIYKRNGRSQSFSTLRRRIKREEETVEPPTAPAYELPYIYYPYPGMGAEDLGPLFPMTHSFNNGIQVQNNANVAVVGHINVPVPNWGIWDLHGNIYPQTSNPTFNYGHLVNPANPLNFSPQEIDSLMTSPEAIKRKKESEKVSVNDLPNTGSWRGYGIPSFSPLRCKPPMCNPYTHTFVNGFMYEQGTDVQVPGKLDFPLPAKEPWLPSYRYQLSMNPIFGVQPSSFNYGHNINAVDPWTAAFKPTAGSYPGNPEALSAVLHPQPKNTVPYVAPPLNSPNVFSTDI